ncbi:MAG: diadenylate cyclase CdaA [Clostridia bacterium]|nr:diadenylate cyclase CdaA [Clostridia bacterium]
MEGIMAFWSQIVYAISNIRLLDVIDILAVTYIIYIAIKYFRSSRSGQLVKGIILLFVIYALANWFQLATIKWLLLRLADSVIIVAAIIFQPELRRALENIGKKRLSNIGRQSISSEEANAITCVNDICKAVSNMQERKIGALIVFERGTRLTEIIATGTAIDASVSTELVQNIFYPKSPLHDGAMIIRDYRIASAGCILPLTANNELNSQLGTRHRAAIGMSENSDAVVVVVSEETGVISVAKGGRIERDYNPISLREELSSFLIHGDMSEKPFYKNWLDKIQNVKKK